MTLNEKISAWFEPKPTTFCYGNMRRYSNKGVWINFGHFGDKWHAIAWDTDESANARLLEAMPEVGLHQDGIGLNRGWTCLPFWNGIERTFHRDRKTAVLLAFCKFAGIEVGDGEAR